MLDALKSLLPLLIIVGLVGAGLYWKSKTNHDKVIAAVSAIAPPTTASAVDTISATAGVLSAATAAPGAVSVHPTGPTIINVHAPAPPPSAAPVTTAASTVVVTSVALPDGCQLANKAGCPGAVLLTGLPAGSDYLARGFAIEAIGLLFPPGSDERNWVIANVDNANGLDLETDPLIGACHPVGLYLDRASGAMIPRVVPGSNAIAGTVAAPSRDRNGAVLYATVAQATAHWGALANPTTNSGGVFLATKQG
jgi:hypothetical protein